MRLKRLRFGIYLVLPADNTKPYSESPPGFSTSPGLAVKVTIAVKQMNELGL